MLGTRICPKQENLPKVCPRSRRHPLRRKNCALMLGGALLVFAVMQFLESEDDWSMLRPLADAESEAKRLLKMMLNYQLQCNSTFHLGNHSAWPLCTEHDTGVDLDAHYNHRLFYSVGWQGDFSMERTLAINYSFQVVIISPHALLDMSSLNNTAVIQTVLVPNDYADFSRNSYGQQTLNAIMSEHGHTKLEVLRLHQTVTSVQVWEVLHFLVADGLMENINQLQLAVIIDKLDEDYLYNWYRTLQALFRNAGFRLFHTASNDPLCLQVTMMESCVYYLSWLRDPGPKVIVMYPPAGFGEVSLEEQRLVSHVTTLQGDCPHQLTFATTSQTLRYAREAAPVWPVCTDAYQLFSKPCTILRFRLKEDFTLNKHLSAHGCQVYTLLAHGSHSEQVNYFQVKGPNLNKSLWSRDELLSWLLELGHVNVLELDLAGSEIKMLTHLMDSGALQHVSHIVMELQLPDLLGRRHPTLLRRKYSELQRLRNHGFQLVHTAPSVALPQRMEQSRLEDSCCHQLSYHKKDAVV